jgi:hypothetical protein
MPRVLVQHDDGDVGAMLERGRADAFGVERMPDHLVAEPLDGGGEMVEIDLALVGDEDAQVLRLVAVGALVRRHGAASSPPRRPRARAGKRRAGATSCAGRRGP